MLWALPFLLLVGLLLPLSALANRRALAKAGAKPAEMPSLRVLAVQALVVQAIVAGLAWLALRSPEVLVAWPSKLGAATLAAAIALLAASLLVARFEARRPLGPADEFRRSLQNVSATDPLWLAVMVVAAIGEEFAYRGVLTGVLAGPLGLGFWPAALVSAGIFGLGHSIQGWRGFAMSAAFGLALQWLVLASGGLALAVVIHLVYDLGALAIGRRAARTESVRENAGSDA